MTLTALHPTPIAPICPHAEAVGAHGEEASSVRSPAPQNRGSAERLPASPSCDAKQPVQSPPALPWRFVHDSWGTEDPRPHHTASPVDENAMIAWSTTSASELSQKTPPPVCPAEFSESVQRLSVSAVSKT